MRVNSLGEAGGSWLRLALSIRTKSLYALIRSLWVIASRGLFRLALALFINSAAGDQFPFDVFHDLVGVILTHFGLGHCFGAFLSFLLCLGLFLDEDVVRWICHGPL